MASEATKLAVVLTKTTAASVCAAMGDDERNLDGCEREVLAALREALAREGQAMEGYVNPSELRRDDETGEFYARVFMHVGGPVRVTPTAYYYLFTGDEPQVWAYVHGNTEEIARERAEKIAAVFNAAQAPQGERVDRRCGGNPGEPWCKWNWEGRGGHALGKNDHPREGKFHEGACDPCEGCPSCDCAPATSDQCPVCQGRGEYMQMQPHGRPAVREQCERCSGTGSIAASPAPTHPNADGLEAAWKRHCDEIGHDPRDLFARKHFECGFVARAEEVGRLREALKAADEMALKHAEWAGRDSADIKRLTAEIASLRAAAGEEVARGIATLGDAVVYVDDDERRIQVRIALRGVVDWTARWDEFCALVVGRSIRILREVKMRPNWKATMASDAPKLAVLLTKEQAQRVQQLVMRASPEAFAWGPVYDQFREALSREAQTWEGIAHPQGDAYAGKFDSLPTGWKRVLIIEIGAKR